MLFDELLRCAKNGEDWAFQEILELYRPMLRNASVIGGVLDEDLYQELGIVLLKCIRGFVET